MYELCYETIPAAAPPGTSHPLSTPEQFAEKFAADLAKYAKVIRESGIPLQD